MPKGKKKTAAQIRAEIKKLEDQLNKRELEHLKKNLDKTIEFKTVQSQIDQLELSDKEVLSLFRSGSAGKAKAKPVAKKRGPKPGKKKAVNKKAKKTSRVTAASKSVKAAPAPKKRVAKKVASKVAAKPAAKKAAKKSPAKKAGDKRANVTAKYRHPSDAKLTWSGRGRQAKWVTDALSGGLSLKDLLIK